MNALKRIKLDRLARARLDPELVKAERHFIKAWENVDIGDYVVKEVVKDWKTILVELRVLSFIREEGSIQLVLVHDIYKGEEVWLYEDEVFYCIRKRY